MKFLPPNDINRGLFSSYMLKTLSYEHIGFYKESGFTSRNDERYSKLD